MREVIRYAFGRTSLGDVMVVVSDRGVVALEFVDDREIAEEALHSRDPNADLVADQMRLFLLLARINRIVDWPEDVSDVPLDLIGTSSEIEVWNLLRQIAVGETTSYGALAARLGARDARAVTVAISKNPIAILIPCHRVLRKNGSVSGYRWGVGRKRVLLEREQLAQRGRK
jgi:AraC family transcriptional regulator, regulatory protein of adaptative response / methylated-DNA-[protein]-cysteine methyltransferase